MSQSLLSFGFDCYWNEYKFTYILYRLSICICRPVLSMQIINKFIYKFLQDPPPQTVAIMTCEIPVSQMSISVCHLS